MDDVTEDYDLDFLTVDFLTVQNLVAKIVYPTVQSSRTEIEDDGAKSLGEAPKNQNSLTDI
eukprot:CAMPEP_0185735334 /NCGR_PEP_ID=MMETSP1171-20130828/24966_1 /TAXON_ID=374046 /ORGANISM="Helicotheca tamensis, Strain CCMP826" /LENGTH=60 /DNA_ID=CAMNT_0028405601 /DNA_START=15 /DNA_END=194 /DNA_ORIENTATION=-